MATGMAWPVRAITARSSSAVRTGTGSRLTRPYWIGRWVVATGERPKRESKLVKTTLIVLAAAASLAANPAFAQSWETTTLPKDEGIAAQSMNSDAADILVWCSAEQVPGVTISLPVMDLPSDIAEQMTISVDGEELRDTLGFEMNPAETGIWINGDANAQWHNVRWLVETLAAGDRLTVAVSSLGFATTFDLQGAREAMAPVVEMCGLTR